MSIQINQQLKETGVAQVLVVLKPLAGGAGAGGAGGAASMGGAASVGALALTSDSAASPLSGLEDYFVQSDLSLNSQIADAGLSFSPAASLTGGPRRKQAPPPPVHIYPNLGLMLGTVNRDGLAGLKSDDRVASVGGAPQLSLIKPVRVEAATMQTKVTWGIEFLGVTKLWAEGLSGKGVRVAHLDTGVDGKHPALKTAIASFAEFDSFGRLVKPSPAAHDTGQHGTHTAATIAGRPVQGRAVGVAPKATLASALVIEGGNVIARVLGGMDWVLTQGVSILSMSLGLPGLLEEFLPITQILRARKVLPVMAVGNEGPGRSRSPGNYAEALSVGAINDQSLIAQFSSSQRFKRKVEPIVPDVAAPGVNVISARPGGGFQAMDGTSMATPHIAGLAALLFEAKPTATIDEVEKAIFNSCKLGKGMSKDRGNRGIPDAARAFKELTGHALGAKPKSSSTASKAKSPASKAKKKVATKKKSSKKAK